MPGNAVASVDGTHDHDDDVQPLAAVAAGSQQPPAHAPRSPCPTRPTSSSASRPSRRRAQAGQGPARPTAAQLKAQCKQEYDAAARPGPPVPDPGPVDPGRGQGPGHQGHRQGASRSSSSSEEAVLPEGSGLQEVPEVVRDDPGGHRSSASSSTCSRTRSATKVTKGKDKVTDAQIKTYYNKNKARFAQPERRDLNIVLTKTKAKAEEAKAALEAGQSWKVVAKKYSIDQASKNTGGKLPGVSRPAGEGLRQRRLHGQEGQDRGPGQDAVRLLRLRGHQDHAQVAAVARAGEADDQAAARSSQNQQKALNDFVKNFAKKWKDKTNCRKGYVVDRCKNAPKPKKTPPDGRRARRPHRAPQRRHRGAAAGDRVQPSAPAPSRAPGGEPPAAGARASTSSRAACGASAPGTASRTSARSSRTPSRRPTSWPTPPSAATTPSCSTSSATCSSRSTSSRCCSRSAARATSPRWPSTAARS